MNCPRCMGPMLSQRYTDLLDDSGQMNITAWRCLICGEVCDAVICANRVSRPPVNHSTSRSRRRMA